MAHADNIKNEANKENFIHNSVKKKKNIQSSGSNHGRYQPHGASQCDQWILWLHQLPGVLVPPEHSQLGSYHHHFGDLFGLLLSLLAGYNSGPTQPSLWTTVEKWNHLVPQVSLALRKKTCSLVLSHWGDYALDLFPSVLSVGQLESAWTFPSFNTWQGQAAQKANTTE